MMFRTSVRSLGAPSFLGSGDRVCGSGSGKCPCVVDTAGILSGSCHGWDVFAPSPTDELYVQEHLPRDPTLFHSLHSAIAKVCFNFCMYQGSFANSLLGPHNNIPPRISFYLLGQV